MKETLTPAVKSVGKDVSAESKTQSTLTTPKQPTGEGFSEWAPGAGSKDKIMK